ncbi:MAG: GNAT family N-acetyltransferase [Deinococcus-Thermus bacterium]|jgi:predicted amidohydrolase/GNAT superfamily N-acetyltransferase|nr:GNAT family N-acetyltransferase [Deinococcota bacterium]
MKNDRPKLVVRQASLRDVDGVIALSRRVYPEEVPYTRGQVSGQINAFQEGTFVAEYGGEIVGYAASIMMREHRVMAPHTWGEISGGGYASQHNGNGDWLYGIEVMVHPEMRRLRIGKRLYQARERLCIDLGLKGIAFGGRIPGFRRHRSRYPDPDAYLEAVKAGDLKDMVIGFQMRNGFEPLRALRNYAPEDLPSGGHAALMIWHNPYYDPQTAEQPVTRANPDVVRVASVQLAARTLRDPEEFYETVDYFTNIASEYGSDFVVFPEHFTLQLLSCEREELPPDQAIERAVEYTDTFVNRLQAMALARAINIVGGSHATRAGNGDILNVCYLFLRDGTVHRQAKLHPTPDERESWNLQGGDSVDVIETDCGPVGALVCYDAEFPEAARRLADEGARILFVPFNTDTRHGHLRVRYCCQARAIENQCYVVTSGMVGNLEYVSNLDIQYAQSAIMTPCDFPFARDGIAAEASENVEMIIVADLNLATIQWARNRGSVRNLRDRRFDLYRTRWRDGG